MTYMDVMLDKALDKVHNLDDISLIAFAENIDVQTAERRFYNDLKVDAAGRGQGKSTRLIQWLNENDNRMTICSTQSEVQNLVLSGASSRKVVSLNTWHTGRYFNHKYKIAVDNADILLSKYLDTQINYITLTGESV